MANITKVALVNKGKVVGAGRNKDNSNLAPIEATTTASRSYLVGDYLMLQGEFYKVISAIAIGDTLTVGTNIQNTTVGDEIVNVDNKIKDYIVENVSIASESISGSSVKGYSIDVHKNGYTPLAIVGFHGNNTNVGAITWYMDHENEKALINARNFTSSSTTGLKSVDILYKAN